MEVIDNVQIIIIATTTIYQENKTRKILLKKVKLWWEATLIGIKMSWSQTWITNLTNWHNNKVILI